MPIYVYMEPCREAQAPFFSLPIILLHRGCWASFEFSEIKGWSHKSLDARCHPGKSSLSSVRGRY